MLRFICSDLKSIFARKDTYMYLAGTVILILIANIAVMSFRFIYGANEGTYAYNLLEYATWCFIIPYYSCIFIAHIVMGKSYPNPNIKDKNTSGLNRTKIYLSKLIACIIIGAIFMIFAMFALIGITSLFQLGDGGLTAYAIKDFLGKMVIATSVWYAGVSFGIMFLFIFENRRQAYLWFAVLTIIIPRFIMFFAAEPFRIGVFRLVRKYTLTQNLSLVPYFADPSRNVPLTIALGVLYGTIATVIGCICYNKKKFK